MVSAATLRTAALSPPTALALLLLAAVGIGSAGADLLAPADPLKQDVRQRLQSPSSAHPFGTDRYGRDILSRVLHGLRLTLLIGGIVSATSLVTGTALGLVSGYRGRWLDLVLMRVVDVVLSFPGILLALAFVTVIGSGIGSLSLALAIVYAPPFARVVRGAALAIREREYVEAARALGNQVPAILLRHVLPNALGPMLIQTTLTFVYVVRAEATLSFLGLGVPPPAVSLGQLVEEGLPFLRTAPWITLLPGAVLALTLFALNAVGDLLRDLFDPRFRPGLGRFGA
jgi:peptide/nickel transport system permease protein